MFGALNQQLGTSDLAYQSKSDIEHEPGPRGSPQLPQAPEGMGVADEGTLLCTAKTESCEARFLPWHLGQLAFSFPMTRVSKEWLQPLQVYSNMGISKFQKLCLR
jgi:hypothetical protein